MSTNLISKLRKITGAGIKICSDALKESNYDIDKACLWLRKNGLIDVLEKSNKFAKQGIIHSYIHGNGVLGVLVEVNCETDFVARTYDFKNLVKEISMQIAAFAPVYISRNQIPRNIIETEKNIYKIQFEKERKSKSLIDKVINGKIEKFYKTVCLYDQIYMRDVLGKMTIKDLVKNTIAKVGENIVIKRFVRFKLGEN
ncbi:MAG: elongation factor Ts [Endomicrobium sp.]|jgi:elongation factor Ts|nr:elongation factor Ts [Endomicrobium sp.]